MHRRYTRRMTEVGRLLRYAVPGGAFGLWLGLWLFADAWGCECALGDHVLNTVALSDSAIGVLLIAAAFPLGFIIAVIANELAWLPLRLHREARVRGRIDTSTVLAMVERGGPHRRWLHVTRSNMELAREGQQKQRQALEAVVELVQRMAGRGEAYGAAVGRVRSLADLMNGLLNLWTALALAVLVSTGVYGLTMRFDPNAADDSSALGLFIGIALVVGGGVIVAGWCCAWVRERVVEMGALALLLWTLTSAGLVVLDLDAVADSRRLLLYLSFAAIALLLLFLISQAERRVAYITEVFVVGMIAADWPTRAEE